MLEGVKVCGNYRGKEHGRKRRYDRIENGVRSIEARVGVVGNVLQRSVTIFRARFLERNKTRAKLCTERAYDIVKFVHMPSLW